MTGISRASIQVTVDAALRGRMVGTGLRATLTPARVSRGFLGWVVVGSLVWLLSRSLPLAVVIGLVLPVVLLVVSALRTLLRVRRAVSEGSVLTSAYDDRGRVVITRDSGDLVLEPGTLSSVERRDDVAVVRWRQRRGPLVTPSALLTDEDVVRLTTDPPVSELPYCVEVTREIRRDIFLGSLQSALRTPAVIVLLPLLALEFWVGFLLPGYRWLSLLAVLEPLVLVGLVWSGTRRTYRPGSEARAGVDREGLRLSVPFHPPLVRRAQIRRISRTGRCLLVVRRNGTRMALPRDLLPSAAMRDLTGQPVQESGAL